MPFYCRSSGCQGELETHIVSKMNLKFPLLLLTYFVLVRKNAFSWAYMTCLIRMKSELQLSKFASRKASIFVKRWMLSTLICISHAYYLSSVITAAILPLVPFPFLSLGWTPPESGSWCSAVLWALLGLWMRCFSPEPLTLPLSLVLLRYIIFST